MKENEAVKMDVFYTCTIILIGQAAQNVCDTSTRNTFTIYYVDMSYPL